MARKLPKRVEKARVFEEMGRVISEWRFLEDNLEAVFNALIDSPHRDLPSVIYYLINSFPVRLKIIDTLIKYRFGEYRQAGTPSKRLRDWGNLRNRIKALEALRNVVAHSLVITYPGNRPNRTHIPPSIFDRSLYVRYHPARHPTLYLKDIVRLRHRIERTWLSIEKFWNRLPEHRPRSKRR
jgi:hypothetical protein